MEKPSSPSLKLFGSWASSYTHRAKLSLKLKGLEFEYVEEDLTNKSLALLQHNPIYKKVPVLLDGDKPIIESLIILQYIDEKWTENTIMPTDPYDRAIARFWCHFADDKLGPAVGAVFASTGESQKLAAVDQVHEKLKLIESELREGAFKGKRFFGGDKIGMLDIVLGCGSYWLAVFEEVMEVKIVDPEAVPLFHAWLKDFEDQDEVKQMIPPMDKLLDYARVMRQMMFTDIRCNDTTTTRPNEEVAPIAGTSAAKVAIATTVSTTDIVVDS